jgi:hypothetical protein
MTLKRFTKMKIEDKVKMSEVIRSLRVKTWDEWK